MISRVHDPNRANNTNQLLLFIFARCLPRYRASISARGFTTVTITRQLVTLGVPYHYEFIYENPEGKINRAEGEIDQL
jgi:hypothetical protein